MVALHFKFEQLNSLELYFRRLKQLILGYPQKAHSFRTRFALNPHSYKKKSLAISSEKAFNCCYLRSIQDRLHSKTALDLHSFRTLPRVRTALDPHSISLQNSFCKTLRLSTYYLRPE
jgi:hypothetical protein